MTAPSSSAAAAGRRAVLIRFLLTAGLALVLAEVLLRLFYPATIYSRALELSQPLYRPAPWLMQPLGNLNEVTLYGDLGIAYTVSTNADGLRSPEATRDKPPGTFRILALGDSFTFGMTVGNDQTYPAALQRALGTALDGSPAVQVINAGFNGFSTDAYYVFYRELGHLYRPDLVTVGLFVDNDLADIAEMTWEVDEDGLPVRIDSLIRYVDTYTKNLQWRVEPVNYAVPILRETHLFQWVYNIFIQPPTNRLNLPEHRITSSPFEHESAWNAALQAAFENLLLTVTATRDRVEAGGGRLLVVLIPQAAQLDGDAPDDPNPQRRLRDALGAAGVEVLDLLPELRPAGREIYFDRNWHFTPEGNVLAGEIIAEYLLAQGYFE